MASNSYVVNEIRRLAVEEGLNDKEIAEIIGCHRVSVNRIRSKHGIPKADYSIRKDKKIICPQCRKEYFIRRNEKPGVACPECARKHELEIIEKYKHMEEEE